MQSKLITKVIHVHVPQLWTWASNQIRILSNFNQIKVWGNIERRKIVLNLKCLFLRIHLISILSSGFIPFYGNAGIKATIYRFMPTSMLTSWDKRWLLGFLLFLIVALAEHLYEILIRYPNLISHNPHQHYHPAHQHHYLILIRTSVPSSETMPFACKTWRRNSLFFLSMGIYILLFTWLTGSMISRSVCCCLIRVTRILRLDSLNIYRIYTLYFICFHLLRFYEWDNWKSNKHADLLVTANVRSAGCVFLQQLCCRQ